MMHYGNQPYGGPPTGPPVNPPLPPDNPPPPPPDDEPSNDRKQHPGYSWGPQSGGQWNSAPNNYGNVNQGPPNASCPQEPNQQWSGNYGNYNWSQPAASNDWNQYGGQNNPPQNNNPGMPPHSQGKRPDVDFDESKDPELIEFDQQFKTWEEKFQAWKDENKDHPDKAALAKYEETWTKWRDELLQKRNDIMAGKLDALRSNNNNNSNQNSQGWQGNQQFPPNSQSNPGYSYGPSQGPGYTGPGGPQQGPPQGAGYTGPGGPQGAGYTGPGGPSQGAGYTGPGGPQQGPSQGSGYMGPGGPQQGAPQGPGYMGPGGPQQGAPQGPGYVGPGGPQQGPTQGRPGGPPQGQPGGPQQGPPQGQPGGPQYGSPGGPQYGSPGAPSYGQHGGPPQGPHGGPSQGQPGGPPHGPSGGPPQGPPGNQPQRPPQGQPDNFSGWNDPGNSNPNQNWGPGGNQSQNWSQSYNSGDNQGRPDNQGPWNSKGDQGTGPNQWNSGPNQGNYGPGYPGEQETGYRPNQSRDGNNQTQRFGENQGPQGSNFGQSFGSNPDQNRQQGPGGPNPNQQPSNINRPFAPNSWSNQPQDPQRPGPPNGPPRGHPDERNQGYPPNQSYGPGEGNNYGSNQRGQHEPNVNQGRGPDQFGQGPPMPPGLGGPMSKNYNSGPNFRGPEGRPPQDDFNRNQGPTPNRGGPPQDPNDGPPQGWNQKPAKVSRWSDSPAQNLPSGMQNENSNKSWGSDSQPSWGPNQWSGPSANQAPWDKGPNQALDQRNNSGPGPWNRDGGPPQWGPGPENPDGPRERNIWPPNPDNNPPFGNGREPNMDGPPKFGLNPDRSQSPTWKSGPGFASFADTRGRGRAKASKGPKKRTREEEVEVSPWEEIKHFDSFVVYEETEITKKPRAPPAPKKTYPVKPKGDAKAPVVDDEKISAQAVSRATGNVLSLFKQRVIEGGTIPGLDLPTKSEKKADGQPDGKSTKSPAKKGETKPVKVEENKRGPLNIGPIGVGVPLQKSDWKPPNEWYDDDEDNDLDTPEGKKQLAARGGKKKRGRGGSALEGAAMRMLRQGAAEEGQPPSLFSYKFDDYSFDRPADNDFDAPSSERGGPRGRGPPRGMGGGPPRGRGRGGPLLPNPNMNQEFYDDPRMMEMGPPRDMDPYNRDGGPPGMPYDDGPRMPYDDGPRMPYDDGPRMPYDDGPGIPFDDPYFDPRRGGHPGMMQSRGPPGRGGIGRGGFDEDPFVRDEFGPFFELGASENNHRPRPAHLGQPPNISDSSRGMAKVVDYMHSNKSTKNGQVEKAAPNEDSNSRKGSSRNTPDSDPDPQPDVVAIDDLIAVPGRFMRPPKLVIVLRGLPGAGKSTMAKMIKDKEIENGGSAPRILCLDDYFMIETEKMVTDQDTGRRVKTKVLEYEYEPELEDRYRSALIKSFKKQVDEKYFPLIIIDAVNSQFGHYKEICEVAKKNDFEQYVVELDTEVPVAYGRNCHHRTLADIQKIASSWEPTPPRFTRLDMTAYIQDADIQEVEMEDCTVKEEGKDDPVEVTKVQNKGSAAPKADEDDEEEDDPTAETFKIINELMKSKWDTVETQEEKLAKLDGVKFAKKKKGESNPQNIEDWLQLSKDYDNRKDLPGKKRVRWADMEERKRQLSARDRGFVFGQTDWHRMTDPSLGSNALVQVHYIEKIS